VLVIAPLVLQRPAGQDGPVSRGERRPDDGALPKLPGEHHVGLAKVYPRQESEHRGEDAVDGVGVKEMAHEIGAEHLQRRPCGASGHRAGQQPAGPDDLGGKNAEGDEVHAGAYV